MEDWRLETEALLMRPPKRRTYPLLLPFTGLRAGAGQAWVFALGAEQRDCLARGHAVYCHRVMPERSDMART
jgi:hypothetical protein